VRRDILLASTEPAVAARQEPFAASATSPVQQALYACANLGDFQVTFRGWSSDAGEPDSFALTTSGCDLETRPHRIDDVASKHDYASGQSRDRCGLQTLAALSHTRVHASFPHRRGQSCS